MALGQQFIATHAWQFALGNGWHACIDAKRNAKESKAKDNNHTPAQGRRQLSHHT
jgi:hypothetical protein